MKLAMMASIGVSLVKRPSLTGRLVDGKTCVPGVREVVPVFKIVSANFQVSQKMYGGLVLGLGVGRTFRCTPLLGN